MGKRKGFKRGRTDMSLCPPIAVLEQHDTTEPRLEAFMCEVVNRRLNPVCYGMFKKLGSMEPASRLAVNIKTVVGLLGSKDVEDTLVDGVSRDERAVLLEVDASGMPVGCRRTAHSLLNMEARLKVVSALGTAFRDARTRKNHKLSERLLDN